MNREKMIVLRTFSNEMFARMAAMHLENLEIKSIILKDDAGGAYPSMQFSEGVRLLIDPADQEKAEATLQQLEGESSSAQEPTSQESSGSDWFTFFWGFLAGLVASGLFYLIYLMTR